MIFSKKLRFILLLFIFIDLAISFNQYFNTPLYGDLTSIVLPASKYQATLSDPFGISAITSNSNHSEANRFFPIVATRIYFKTIPFAAQSFMSPISSIYFSSALFKFLIHVLIIFILSSFISGKANFRDDKFILSAALFTVFFQVGGYSSTMGIIDSAITYAISYSLPLTILLIILYPLVQKHIHSKEVNLDFLPAVLLIILSFLISFSGNLISILDLTLLILYSIGIFMSNKRSNNLKTYISGRNYKLCLIVLIVFSFYSLFLSFYNSERDLLDVSMIDRFKKVPIGIFNIFFGKPGLWILTLLISINSMLLKKSKSENSRSFSLTLKWAVLFVSIYTLLQPLDGYYEFRPNIIRRDNFLPCILLIVFLFVQSSIYLAEHYWSNGKLRRLVGLYLFAVILLFTIADSPSLRMDNCERASLEMLSLTNEKITRLSDQCPIASWYIIYDYKDSEVNSAVFKYWNITKEPRPYFQN